MKKAYLFLFLILLSACVVGKHSPERDALYTTKGHLETTVSQPFNGR